jgi:hypothetical protein
MFLTNQTPKKGEKKQSNKSTIYAVIPCLATWKQREGKTRFFFLKKNDKNGLR